MKNIYAIISIVFLAACGSGADGSLEKLIEKGDIDALKAKKAELTSKIKDEESQIAKINNALDKQEGVQNLPLVSVFQTENKDFQHFVELQGSVETNENILVYPEMQGTLINFKVNMGDRVSKGQTVAIIDDGGMQQQLEQMKQKAALSKITFEKRKRLWNQKVGSEIDFLSTETQYKADQEAVKQMEAQLAKARVKAPFSGQIDETIADEGQLVVPGQTALFRIISLNKMYIHADVPEQYLSNIKKGKKVLVEFPVLDTILITEVAKVSNYINPDNRTFKIEIDVPNESGLIKPNLTARLKINDYSSTNSILIPQSIISENSDGKEYVFTANSKKKSNIAIAKKVFIETGKKQDDLIEIVKGLKANDALINEGARTVKDQQEVKIIK